MTASTRHAERALLLLMSGASFIHLISASSSFDRFAWWFGVVVLPVHVLVVWYVVTLQRRVVAAPDAAPAVQQGGTQDASESRLTARLRSATS